MPKNNFISKRYVFASFFCYYCFELLLLCLSSRSWFGLFCFDFLRVHLVIDFKRTSWKYFEKGLAIIADVESFTEWKHMIFIVYLKVEVRVSVPKWLQIYDLLVKKVFAFS